MNTVIDRDENQQEKFARKLIDFENDMRACTKSLRGHIEEARDNIQADNARAALDSLLQLLDDIESALPGIVEFGSIQLKQAHNIQYADSYTFTKS